MSSLLLRRTLTAALGTAVLVGATAAGAGVLARTRTETPDYTVAEKHDGFEVRRYEPRIVAEVEVEGEGRKATSAGFRVLADFIFGNNTAQTKVAMTAPVDRTQNEEIAMTAPVDRTQKGERWTIAFTMPSKYTLETLPRPNDERVKIREVPPTSYAVMRFSGNPRESVVQERMDALTTMVSDAGLETAGLSPTYARYDPPWTPSFMRRNEIMLQLAPEPKE